MTETPEFKNHRPQVQHHRNIVLAAIKQNGFALKDASEVLRNDREIVLAAVQRDGNALEYASKELQKDPEIVYAAVQSNGHALQFASPEIKTNRHIVLSAVQRDGRALQYASPELQNDKPIVLAAVKHNGLVLEYASEGLQNDEEIVLTAIQQNGHALQFASLELLLDKQNVLTAVKQSGSELQFVGREFRDDKEIVLAAIQQNGQALQFVSPELRNDKEIILTAIQQNGIALQYANQELQNDRELVSAAVQQNSMALQHAGPELRNDKQIVLSAVQHNGLMLQFASPELKNDKDIVLTAVKQDGNALAYASAELKGDKYIVYAAIQKSDDALAYASAELRNNKYIVYAAVQRRGATLRYASQELKKDKELVLTAVGESRLALRFASPELQNDKDIISAANKNHSLLGSKESLQQPISHDPKPQLDIPTSLGSQLITPNLLTRQKLLHSVSEYLSSFPILTSAAVTYRLDQPDLKIILLFTPEPHQLRAQLQLHPCPDSSFQFQVFRPGDVHSLPPDTDPPSLSIFEYQYLLPAYNHACQTLFVAHSNITIITIGHHSIHSTWSTQPCILVYAYTKGYIPWGEDPFPKTILGQELHVLEGICDPCVGQPLPDPAGEYRYVDPISPGVSIGSTFHNNDGSIHGEVGTLGAFLTNQSNEVYVLTNCHIVEGNCHFHPRVNSTPTEIQQPAVPDWDRYLRKNNALYRLWYANLDCNTGHVIPNSQIQGNINYLNRSVGLDVAICKYTASRERRPDPQIEDYKYSSQIWRIDEEFKTDQVVKKGRSTGITYGRLQIPPASVAYYSFLGDVVFNNHSKEFGCRCDPRPANPPAPVKIRMDNQYAILGENGIPFAARGDSGSMCYVIENNQIRPVGLFHSTIRNTTIGLASPIDAVMHHLPGYTIV